MIKLTALFLSVSLLIPSSVIKKSEKYIALTFDDGPHPKYTAQILKILYDNEAMATFFVIGENAERYPYLVRAEYDLGHEIGNHTYHHDRKSDQSLKTLADDIKRADDIIYEITGQKPLLFRPPEGKRDKTLDDIVKKAGKSIVLWTVDTRDWAHTDKDKIIKNITENTKNGSVILFHDYISPPSPTPEVLCEILPYLKEKGYKFVTVSELLKRKADIGELSSFFIG